jgi:alkanesulfonate monooxygenase SsuD/methylene tetrahydromethanopterin reductase-like flavin-dependent oxidoreductase (luciferase family)
VRALLRGERVTFEGRQVHHRDVLLDQPPTVVPPVLAGVRSPKSLALAGRVADGVVLAEAAGPDYIRRAVQQAAAPGPFRVSVFSAVCIEADRADAYRWMAPALAGWLSSPNPAIDAHPHAEELKARFTEGGEAALATMPRDWWLQLGAIGTFDDALEHVQALGEAGAHDVALFPAPEWNVGRGQVDDAIALAAALHHN